MVYHNHYFSRWAIRSPFVSTIFLPHSYVCVVVLWPQTAMIVDLSSWTHACPHFTRGKRAPRSPRADSIVVEAAARPQRQPVVVLNLDSLPPHAKTPTKHHILLITIQLLTVARGGHG